MYIYIYKQRHIVIVVFIVMATDIVVFIVIVAVIVIVLVIVCYSSIYICRYTRIQFDCIHNPEILPLPKLCKCSTNIRSIVEVANGIC